MMRTSGALRRAFSQPSQVELEDGSTQRVEADPEPLRNILRTERETLLKSQSSGTEQQPRDTREDTVCPDVHQQRSPGFLIL